MFRPEGARAHILCDEQPPFRGHGRPKFTLLQNMKVECVHTGQVSSNELKNEENKNASTERVAYLISVQICADKPKAPAARLLPF